MRGCRAGATAQGPNLHPCLACHMLCVQPGHACPFPRLPSVGKVPGDDCPLVWGQCSHCFHMHCILKWLHAQQVQQHCPMCRQEWKFKE